MNFTFVILVFVFIFCINIININALDKQTLKAVHLIFRHGDRCPEKSNLYRTSPYYNESYLRPYGFGQLTNKGKLTAYNLGREMRERYTGFLEEEYNIHLIEARSSDFNRTKESLQAVLAGLFPPTAELNWLPGLNWQPIAFTYVEREADTELLSFGCSTWDPTMKSYLATNEGLSLLGKYEHLLQLLTKYTQEDYNGLLKAYLLFYGFETLREMNLTLPEWSKEVYPQPLLNLTLDYYNMITATSTLRQISGGYLLKHILNDSQEKIEGKIPQKKMFIWSAHENNVASLLKIMNVWHKPEVITYGSYILMELHYVNGTYGFQILHKNHAEKPTVLKLPNCDTFCPINEFRHLVQSDIPADASVCRGVSSSAPLEVKITLMVLSSLITLFTYQ